MKSDHRHELQTNDLSARLAKLIEDLKPFSGQIITGIVLFAVVYFGLSIWDAQQSEGERAAWDAFALATDTRDPEQIGLQRIASDDQYAGTKMQEWAYVSWCDRQVLNAMQTSLYDREKTSERLQKVSGIYENLAAGAGDPQVMNRARFGLGRVYELQNKLDEAKQQYELVKGDLEPLASERARQLESEEVREASNWLATAVLPKRDLTGGQGATGQRPDFKAGLPAASNDSVTPKSLEELLGDFNSNATPDNRYGENETSNAENTDTEATEAETTDDGATDDGASSDTEKADESSEATAAAEAPTDEAQSNAEAPPE